MQVGLRQLFFMDSLAVTSHARSSLSSGKRDGELHEKWRTPGVSGFRGSGFRGKG